MKLIDYLQALWQDSMAGKKKKVASVLLYSLLMPGTSH